MKLEISKAQAILNQKRPDTEKAIRILRRVIQRNHSIPWMVYHYLGVAELQRGGYAEADKNLEKALKAGSEEPETYHCLSIAQFNLGKLEEAAANSSKALELKPDFFKGWLHLGSVYRAQANLDEALKCYQKANHLDPKSAGVAYRIGCIYKDQGDLAKALELFEITLKIEPEHIDALIEMGVTYDRQKKFEQAGECFNKILEIDKYHLGGLVGLAEVYKHEGDYAGAMKIYEEVLERQPGMAKIRINYALCLQELCRFDESEEEYRKAMSADPDLEEGFSNYLMGMHYNPKRSREEIFEAHIDWEKHFACKTPEKRPVPENLDPDKKLRIGFLSGGLRRHPVGWMITSALENLPVNEFEIYCYTTNNIVDPLTRRINERAKVWRSVIGYDDEVIARLIRDDEIDILVEMSGHSDDNRLKVVTREPAPVIVKWVGGLFNTTGLKSVDYLISDKVETPEGTEKFYTESLVRMPDDYICYLPPEYCPEVGPLPYNQEGYITFGCFNNPTKVNSALLEKWAEIMANVPGSRLFLKSRQYDTPLFTDRVKDIMRSQGICEDRLIFEGESLHDELLNSYNNVDIALDPWPYSGGLSTIEALWMGVPVVTTPGPTFAGRHAATHLVNAGLEELLTDNWEEYARKVIELATNPDKLADMRENLREQVAQSPLVDAERFGTHLSRAFREMWKQYVKGMEEGIEHWSSNIDVPPVDGKKTPTGLPYQSPKESKKETNGEAGDLLDSISRILNGNPEAEQDLNTPDLSHKIFVSNSGVKVALPENTSVLSSYVMEEQNSWLDPEIQFLKNYLEKGMKVVDAGASFGAYALEVAARVGDEGRVYAFEPSGETGSYLRLSRELNDFDQLEIIEKALGNETSKVTLVPGESPELDKISDTENKPSGLEQITLDAWWKEAGCPEVDVLKVDVNGMETEVLTGAKELIKACSPVMLFAKTEDVLGSEEFSFILSENDYGLFEYIPNLQILSAFEGNGDAYRLNLIALNKDQQNELMELGSIFDPDAEAKSPEKDCWKTQLSAEEWTSAFFSDWKTTAENEAEELYFIALDHVCEARSLLKNDSSHIKSRRPEAAQLLLKSAQPLIDLYNNSPGNIPVSLTLAHTMLTIGKRTEAVAILKNLTEQVLAKGAGLQADLPFVLPLTEQAEHVVETTSENWLKVKILEGWLLAKDHSTYFCSAQEKQIFHGLEGNPDTLPAIEKISGKLLTKPEKSGHSESEGKFIHFCFNHVYAKSLSDLIEFTNQHSNQEHWLYIEKSQAIEGYNANVEGNPHSTYFDQNIHLNIIIKRCLEENVDGVFIHGLFFSWQSKLIQEIGNEKHIGWILWGGDLYNPIKANKPIHDLAVYIDSIHSIVDGDIEIFTDQYGERASYVFGYPYPGLYGRMPVVSETKKGRKIIVGNSGDASNQHIAILEMLAKKEDIGEYQLILPVSYNLSKQYEEQLNRRIDELGLSNNTQLIKEFMSPDQYLEMMIESSMLITAHQRQQAIGNILASLYSGNITFLRDQIQLKNEIKQNPTWELLQKHQLKVKPLNELEQCKALNDLEQPSEDEVTKRQNIIRNAFGQEKRSEELVNSCNEILKSLEAELAN